MRGIVKKFDSQKGWGFIKADDGTDVFVHHSAIMGQGKRKNLDEGQAVEFNVEEAPKGPKASNVRVVVE